MLLVRVEAVGRLVEDQHVGIVHERLGNADAPLETFRKRLDALVPDVREVDALHELGEAVVGLPSSKVRAFRR